ncbi:9079_t:CDS:2 [Entrophospora sp. SA101]|nr:9079_t:CDS:2 [Entrophospora sp. SA101]
MKSNEISITLPTGKKIQINTGLFINNEFVEAVDGKKFETINPTTGEVITKVAEASAKDVDIAVEAAIDAYNNVWCHVEGKERGKLLNKLANLMERDLEELAALESLDNGKAFSIAKDDNVPSAIEVYRYYAGWSDKIHGKVIETSPDKFTYTRHEPFGCVGAIIPWNFPLEMQSWKLAPALACGNTVVLKTSEYTPLSALKVAALIKEAGFPKGVVNILSGYGEPAGSAIAKHMKIEKIAFTGSTIVGKSILKASAESNLKKVSLELGGKSPSIIFADADLDDAVTWTNMGIYYNHGQCCCASSRVYVQDTIYDQYLEKFKEHTSKLKVGDPFVDDTYQGPQISQKQFDRIMSYIETGKKEGATCLIGGERLGDKDEIFGPVVAISKFKTAEEAVEKAHLTKYGLGAAVFTKDMSRAIKISNSLKAGTVWESGMGRELGKYGLSQYTQVKTVNIHLENK